MVQPARAPALATCASPTHVVEQDNKSCSGAFPPMSSDPRASAQTALQYLSSLGARVKSLDERVTAGQTRDDRLAHSLADVADRLNRAQDRASYREFAAFQADRAAEADQQRERARADSIRCEQHQHRYDEAFQPFNKRAPSPSSDAHPGTFRRELFREAQRLLPSSSELAAITAARIDSSAIIPLEAQLFGELRREADNPSYENRPQSPDDPRALRIRTDASGLKSYEYHAKESFIKSIGRPGRLVARILNPKTGHVLYGDPLPRAPGR
jgi:hypothetical protein